MYELMELLGTEDVKGKYEEAYKHVIKNLEDENTKATSKRKITLEIIFKQDDAREVLDIDVAIKETLAPRVMKKKILSTERPLPGQVNIDDLIKNKKDE